MAWGLGRLQQFCRLLKDWRNSGLLDWCPLSRAPHPLSLYNDLLEACHDRLRTRNGRFVSVQEHLASPTPPDQARVILRHDLDTRNCIEQAPALLEILKRSEFTASWYIRVDGFQYTPEQARSLVASLLDAKQHVGLHAAPYLFTRPMEGFREYSEIFEQAFGFAASTFTIHGLPCPEPLRLRRREFVEDYAASGASPLCDSVPTLLYDRVAGDAQFTPDRKYTYLERKQWREAMDLGVGMSVLLLFHPCYWGKNGIATPEFGI